MNHLPLTWLFRDPELHPVVLPLDLGEADGADGREAEAEADEDEGMAGHGLAVVEEERLHAVDDEVLVLAAACSENAEVGFLKRTDLWPVS